MLRVGRGDLALGLQLHAILHRVERRLAVRVERDDLAVEDHAARPAGREFRHELRKRVRELDARAATQAHAFRIDECDHAIAVELRLPHPRRIVERRSSPSLGVHRLDRLRHRDDLGRSARARVAGIRCSGTTCDLLDRRAGQHRAVLRRDDPRRSTKRSRCLIMQPRLRFLRADERERAFELLAAQQDAELALRVAFANLLLGFGAVVEPGAVLVGTVDAAIPDDDLAGAVLRPAESRPRTRRSRTDGPRSATASRLSLRIERRALRHGPGLQHAVAFEPEVVMQPPRRMLLHDEHQRPLAGVGDLRQRARA